MFVNRISESFPPSLDAPLPLNMTSNGPFFGVPNLGAVASATSLAAIYQAAAEQAARDFELNKLFNPEFYGIPTDGEQGEVADDEDLDVDWR